MSQQIDIAGSLAALVRLARLIEGPPIIASPSGPPPHDGFRIAVLDRGFVYVGEVSTDGEFCVIRGARNVRYWGTTDGLGQLALEGPTDKTKLDRVGTVRVPARALISLIDTEERLWNAS